MECDVGGDDCTRIRRSTKKLENKLMPETKIEHVFQSQQTGEDSFVAGAYERLFKFCSADGEEMCTRLPY